jgi:hypothetical protein
MARKYIYKTLNNFAKLRYFLVWLFVFDFYKINMCSVYEATQKFEDRY